MSPPPLPAWWQVLQPTSVACGPPLCMVRPGGSVASKLRSSWQAPQARLEGCVFQ